MAKVVVPKECDASITDEVGCHDRCLSLYGSVQELGQGGWGRVCRLTHEGQQYALKYFEKDYITQHEDQGKVYETLKAIKSKHIVEYYQFIYHFQPWRERAPKYRWCVTMKACLYKGGSGKAASWTLRDLLSYTPFQDKIIVEKQVAVVVSWIIVQLGGALGEMHSQGLAHQDLAGRNVLLTDSDGDEDSSYPSYPCLVIIDCDMAGEIGSKRLPAGLADVPEKDQDKVLAETDIHMLAKIVKEELLDKLDTKEEISLMPLIEECLSHDPTKRPKLEELVDQAKLVRQRDPFRFPDRDEKKEKLLEIEEQKNRLSELERNRVDQGSTLTEAIKDLMKKFGEVQEGLMKRLELSEEREQSERESVRQLNAEVCRSAERERALEAKLARLREKNEETRFMLDGAQREAADLGAQLEKAAAERTDLAQRVAELQGELREVELLKGTVETQEQELAQLRGRVAELQGELQEVPALRERAEALQREGAGLRAQLERAQLEAREQKKRASVQETEAGKRQRLAVDAGRHQLQLAAALAAQSGPWDHLRKRWKQMVKLANQGETQKQAKAGLAVTLPLQKQKKKGNFGDADIKQREVKRRKNEERQARVMLEWLTEFSLVDATP